MSGAAPFDPSFLRRWPDIEAPELQAHDAADRLLLGAAAERGLPGPGGLVVVNDHYGALTLGAAALGAAGVRVHQDGLSGERALEENAGRAGAPAADFAVLGLGPELFAGARLVLLQLPRSLDALDEVAGLAAEHGDQDLVLLAGGRVKHMNLAMNDVLGRHFGSVSAGLARQKARVLTATSPCSAAECPASRFPLEAQYDAGLSAPLRILARGGTFGGPRLDPGTRFLLPRLAEARPAATAVDLGCGNGTIAAFLALSRPGLRVRASDQSASAVSSTAATAEANGVADRIDVVRDDALSSLPDASQELVVLNPPFHVGNAVHAGIALKLIADAGRVLAPGGELWCVWNSHLRYRPQLERLVGPTRQVDRNPKFTITVSTRPDRP
ncbi:class I SAM-dependent methyltransferase [Zafaria sp. Z1313]|uniref:class I SAM-dependent methyltransferase n=1 Tax=unclassified Zafaria TaxID=2828765 RepID=UPI002E78437D|nr:methyltransferase [Zafaria sp. J156]MEE1620175.1 methyltransferase [Zafaria sp. J156]